MVPEKKTKNNEPLLQHFHSTNSTTGGTLGFVLEQKRCVTELTTPGVASLRADPGALNWYRLAQCKTLVMC